MMDFFIESKLMVVVTSLNRDHFHDQNTPFEMIHFENNIWRVNVQFVVSHVFDSNLRIELIATKKHSYSSDVFDKSYRVNNWECR